MSDSPRVVGVCGAGTMGWGIATLACVAAERVLLWDPDEAALARGAAAVAKELEGGAARGRWAAGLDSRLQTVSDLTALSDCEVIVEAAPERLSVKHELFDKLAAIAPDAVLATNTSSIPVTAVAAGREQVVGMHFFNPATRMKLVEVITGETSGEWAVDRVRALGEAMGKQVIDAADVPGFLVNRCNRPFGLEALRCVSDGLADFETVDRIVRLGGGFRMGPFELQDLVGIDTGFDVSESFYELSFGEPRWRPSPLSARMVASGRHGRKTGRGWYAYPEGRPADPPAPEPAPPPAGSMVVVAGDLPLADALRDLATAGGWDVRDPEEAEGEEPFLILDLGADPHGTAPLQGGPQALLVAEASLSQLDPGGAAVGFHAFAPLAAGGLVELTRSRDSADAAAEAAEQFFASLGLHTAWVGDAPGLVLGRIVGQVINECAFAVGEGVGSAEDVDTGMVLGLNQPRGPLAWADEIGLDHVLAILDALRVELGEERYRASPLLRRLVAEGRVGVQAGEGFGVHDD